MRDQRLDEQIQKTEFFLEAWQQFRAVWPPGLGVGVAEPITAQQENDFLDLQRELARECEVLKRMSGCAVENDGDAIVVLSHAVSLRVLKEMPAEEKQQLESDWHKMLLRTEAMLGQLKARQIELASLNVVWFWAGRWMRHPLVIVVGVILGIALFFFLVDQFELLPRR